ncbi:hypothetical protein J1614_005781, partial [Plenodomus biglobosus]
DSFKRLSSLSTKRILFYSTIFATLTSTSTISHPATATMQIWRLFLLVLACGLDVFGLLISDFDDSATFNVSSNICVSEGAPQSHHRLFRRAGWEPNLAADDATWNRAVSNGAALNCIMRRTDKDAGKVLRDLRNPPSAASQFTYNSVGESMDVLYKWYWIAHDPLPGATPLGRRWGWTQAMKATGLTTSSNRPYRVEHWDAKIPVPPQSQRYTADGYTRWATAARAAFVLHKPAGVIYIQAFTNAKMEFQRIWGRVPNANELPAIRLLSDILWAYWIRTSGQLGTPPALKFYGIMNITQPASKGIIMRALNNQEPQVWPGVTFTADEEAGRALIGSIGASLAQLLFQHKADLGLQHIKSMTVFRNSVTADDLNALITAELLFFIEPVPPHLLIPQEADDWQPGRGAGSAAAVLQDQAANETLPVYEHDEHGGYFRTHMI